MYKQKREKKRTNDLSVIYAHTFMDVINEM